MPTLPPYTLDCVCYLYANEEDARAGRNFGGTAFLTAIESSVAPGRAMSIAVTNWHVAVKHGYSFLRINRLDGGADVFPYGPEDWHFDPRYDIAFVAGVPISNKVHRFKVIPIPAAVLRNPDDNKPSLGPGEDVFMVGRFMDHDGGPNNRPAVRFGHISVMPSPIQQPNGQMADAFCVDMHSRSGYSGSPVFVYRTPGSDLGEALAESFEKSAFLMAGTSLLMLLGIHFGQFPEEWELAMSKSGALPTHSEGVPLITDGAYVRGLSGMTCVLPSWTIMEVFETTGLIEAMRKLDEKERAKQIADGNVPPVAESAGRSRPSEESATDDAADAKFRATLGTMLSTLPTPRVTDK